MWLIFRGVLCLVAGEVWERERIGILNFGSSFFGFGLLEELKRQRIALYNCFALFGYSESVGNHFESGLLTFQELGF